MKTIAKLVALLAVSAFLAGCSEPEEKQTASSDAVASKDSATAETTPPPTSAPPTQKGTAAKAATATTAPAKSTAKGSSGTETAGGSSASTTTPTTQPGARPAGNGEPERLAYTSQGDFPLTVRISPSCVNKGDVLTVELKTRPWASVAASLAFSDKKAYEAYKIGAADPTGAWRWKPVVPKEAPEGPAELLLAVQDRSADSNDEGAKTNGEGAAGRWAFQVGNCS